jgi:hypothetical protein
MTQKIGGKVSRKIHFPLPQFDSRKESFFDGFRDSFHKIKIVNSWPWENIQIYAFWLVALPPYLQQWYYGPSVIISFRKTYNWT